MDTDKTLKIQSHRLPMLIGGGFAAAIVAAVGLDSLGTAAPITRTPRKALETLHDAITNNVTIENVCGLGDYFTGKYKKATEAGDARYGVLDSISQPTVDKNLNQAGELLKWVITNKDFLIECGVKLAVLKDQTPENEKAFLRDFKYHLWVGAGKSSNNLPRYQILQELLGWYDANRELVKNCVKTKPKQFPLLTKYELGEDAKPLHLQVEKPLKLIPELADIRDSVKPNSGLIAHSQQKYSE